MCPFTPKEQNREQSSPPSFEKNLEILIPNDQSCPYNITFTKPTYGAHIKCYGKVCFPNRGNWSIFLRMTHFSKIIWQPNTSQVYYKGQMISKQSLPRFLQASARAPSDLRVRYEASSHEYGAFLTLYLQNQHPCHKRSCEEK